MDAYHVPHGEGSGFKFGVGLSVLWFCLSSLGGDPNNDTFFCHTFLEVGFASTSFFSDSRNFLRWILRLALLWL